MVLHTSAVVCRLRAVAAALAASDSLPISRRLLPLERPQERRGPRHVEWPLEGPVGHLSAGSIRRVGAVVECGSLLGAVPLVGVDVAVGLQDEELLTGGHDLRTSWCVAIVCDAARTSPGGDRVVRAWTGLSA